MFGKWIKDKDINLEQTKQTFRGEVRGEYRMWLGKYGNIYAWSFGVFGCRGRIALPGFDSAFQPAMSASSFGSCHGDNYFETGEDYYWEQFGEREKSPHLNSC